MKLCLCLFVAAAMLAPLMPAQKTPASEPAPTDSAPIAIVPIDARNPGEAAKVTGALEVAEGRAVIVSSGTVTSGSTTTQVTLPRRGVLRVCASTTVKLAADTTVPAGEVPGLLMALDHGAVEASYAVGRNSDIVLTPDFRILIGGPGAAEVKVRLGQHGDTCVDNPGLNAPYVLVSSVFEGGAYRVQPGQRVMFEHGSLHEVVDNEKEPCGCPPPPAPDGNEFPLAQSEGLAPLAAPKPDAANPPAGGATAAAPAAITAPLTYSSAAPAPPPAPEVQPPAPAASAPAANAVAPANTTPKKKQGFFSRMGGFFRRIFGAE